MDRLRDVIVVGGGPAGLAVAIAAAQRGVDVLVLERGSLPADKACGEGILPAGVRALDELGVRAHVASDGHAVISAIRWIDREIVAEAALPAPGGLGIRRTVLSAALLGRAREAGVEIRTGVAVLGHERRSDAAEVVTNQGRYRARLLVAADGLASHVRRREALEVRTAAAPRFGLRRHFACTPWTSAVEVHFGEGAEAYVTPVGPNRVGIALLCESFARASYPALLARFAAVQRRVSSAPYDSPLAGAGPFPCVAKQRALDRLVLVGDAAGYVDAITGEGLALAFEGALALARMLPDALASGATREAFAEWERGEARRFRRYASTARMVLALSRQRAARRQALQFLARHPRVFGGLVGAAVG